MSRVEYRHLWQVIQERHRVCENDCGESRGDHFGLWNSDRQQRHHDWGHHAHHALLCLASLSSRCRVLSLALMSGGFLSFLRETALHCSTWPDAE